jgi:hypothetical protein
MRAFDGIGEGLSKIGCYVIWVSKGSNKDLFDTYYQQTKGVVLGHAYTILDAMERGPRRFVKIRNPWGGTPYKNRVQNMPRNHEDDRGTFWMEFNEFQHFYTSVSIENLR